LARRPIYREIEHTADVGFELTAPDLTSAFESAAAAMFDLICDLDTIGSMVRRTVRASARAGDREGLMVRWLSELLYVLAAEGLLLSEFDVRELSDGMIEASVAGEPLDLDRHALRTDIKAATYHDLAVEQSDVGWVVRVIFDT
jgi:SHS2 domain-containing protein